VVVCMMPTSCLMAGGLKRPYTNVDNHNGCGGPAFMFAEAPSLHLFAKLSPEQSRGDDLEALGHILVLKERAQLSTISHAGQHFQGFLHRPRGS
jgi:hypothetical protein